VLSCCHAAKGEPSCAACLIAAAAALVADSDRTERTRAAAAEMWRAWAADHAEELRAEGYADAIADIKGVQRELVGLARELAGAERWRWTVRGEVRTRERFADPHPADYLGGPVAWERAA
jgi:hypothetical protein